LYKEMLHAVRRVVYALREVTFSANGVQQR
jgi:hypothetical protein